MSLTLSLSIPQVKSHSLLDSERTSQTDKNFPPIPSCSIGGLVNHDHKVFIPLPCKQWRCAKCGPRNGRKVARRLRSSEAKTFNRLLTLPFYVGPMRSWEEAIEISGASLNLFFTKLRKVQPGLRYFWVREIGKRSNMVHFHVLVDRFLPRKLLSKLWGESGGGYVIDIRRGNSSYVLKYLVKYPSYSQAVWDALRWKRHYSCSRKLLNRLERSCFEVPLTFTTCIDPSRWVGYTVYGSSDGVLLLSGGFT